MQAFEKNLNLVSVEAGASQNIIGEMSGIILFPDGTPTGEAVACEITF